MVETGVECAEKLRRQDRWDNLEDQKDLLGAVLLLSLGVMKREILVERQSVLLTTIQYLECLQLSEKQARKPKDYIREFVCDYQLVDMQFKEFFPTSNNQYKFNYQLRNSRLSGKRIIVRYKHV